MFENRLSGNIPDNTYVMTYAMFDDVNAEEYHEAFYCMSKFTRSKPYASLDDVYI